MEGDVVPLRQPREPALVRGESHFRAPANSLSCRLSLDAGTTRRLRRSSDPRGEWRNVSELAMQWRDNALPACYGLAEICVSCPVCRGCDGPLCASTSP